ncbi:hypothetical protein jhhlp_002187 [Lomentospora prolificans]|uniref:Shugoshin C-terminal domain-containing protein n=1 Tax=Lomentospora prolificans TaxID=41688 RepID=A0A2N3ND97_9PEZI|nr:hypothetical protein jhhlp_002187 [Lomentospora prolificans]
MARLNDPPQPADSYETLRRKLLRQNRDLARVNSTQSLKIRHLENECARMLSENLELRSQILQMEKEVENSKAQRIADHALEIKAKLEEQLVEWGHMLSGLGLEPPAKRRDAIGRRATQHRTSLTKRSPRKSLRDLAKEAEARARDEGRLTPIQEHRAYPRPTLDSEDIMALRSDVESADVSGSSDIGPPPVSRFVDEDCSVAPESPSKPPTPKETADLDTKEAEPKPSAPRIRPAKPEPVGEPSPITATAPLPTRHEPSQDLSASVPVKTGSKRKLGAREEPEVTTSANVSSVPLLATARRKSAISKERTGGKTLRELAAMRRESREPSVTPVLAPTTARKPLAAKSTNEDISSPKKPTGKKGSASDEKPIKSKPSKEDITKRSTRSKDITPVIVIKEKPVLATTEVIVTPVPEPEPVAEPVATLEANLLSPSPEPKHQAESNDTPPPADISWKGETTRPSRRARAPVSYAEPNLRDKMRRPTKELVDAVTGEGKYRRTSSLLAEELAAMTSQGKRDSAAGGSSKQSTPAPEPANNDLLASPLAQKSTVDDALPSSVVTERRKRRSSVLLKESIDVHPAPDTPSKASDDSLDISINSTTTSESSSLDIYEFPSNSPDTSSGDGSTSETTARKPRVSRRVSTAGHTELSLEKEEMAKPSRKRTSMHVGRRPKQDLGDASSAQGAVDSSIAAAARERASRRKSTML